MKRRNTDARLAFCYTGALLSTFALGYHAGQRPEPRPVTYTIIRVTGQKPAATLPKTVDALAKWRGLPGWKGVGR